MVTVHSIQLLTRSAVITIAEYTYITKINEIIITHNQLIMTQQASLKTFPRQGRSLQVHLLSVLVKTQARQSSLPTSETSQPTKTLLQHFASSQFDCEVVLFNGLDLPNVGQFWFGFCEKTAAFGWVHFLALLVLRRVETD